ncbi:hypothetical protein [Natronoarchaeum philippinense]|nr:hypothetical protein [Natronoarchaeum philippinense]
MGEVTTDRRIAVGALWLSAVSPLVGPPDLGLGAGDVARRRK